MSEGPSYFSNAISEWCKWDVLLETSVNYTDYMHVDEHLPVHILDRKGRKDPNFFDPDVHSALWHNTIVMAIKEPYENFAMWKTAFRALNVIIKIVASRAQIQKQVDTCARAVGWLKDFLRLITKQAKRLPNLLPGSPMMRGMFVSGDPETEQGTILREKAFRKRLCDMAVCLALV